MNKLPVKGTWTRKVKTSKRTGTVTILWSREKIHIMIHYTPEGWLDDDAELQAHARETFNVVWHDRRDIVFQDVCTGISGTIPGAVKGRRGPMIFMQVPDKQSN